MNNDRSEDERSQSTAIDVGLYRAVLFLRVAKVDEVHYIHNPTRFHLRSDNKNTLTNYR